MDESLCPSCRRTFRYQKVHSGFNNTGYAYCDSVGALLVWDTFDPQYTSLVGEQHPWTLDRRDQGRVESALQPCPCGGHFGMGNPPLCPRCGNGIRDLFPDPIYFLDLGRRFDPARDGLWRTAEQ
jgi:hypothetical protein